MSKELLRIGLIIIDALIIAITDSKITKALGVVGIICLAIALSRVFIQ